MNKNLHSSTAQNSRRTENGPQVHQRRNGHISGGIFNKIEYFTVMEINIATYDNMKES